MRLNEHQQNALLVKANAEVEQRADDAARIICGLDPVGEVAYPPNGGLLDGELAQLERLRQHPESVAPVRKIVADAISRAIFHFLSCIDGVAEPPGYTDPWLPISLHMPIDESEDEPEDLDMYHNSFFDAYWDWRDQRPDPGWRLDNWEGDSPRSSDNG